MESNIMETINTVYKSSPTLEEQEILKLDALLTQVGGDAKSILLSAEKHTMADFLVTCIRNGITFELRNDNSRTAPKSDDKPLPMQSPAGKYNSCEKCCTEAEVCFTRITLENWKDLLSVGDRVVSIDNTGNDKLVQQVTDLEHSDYVLECFMELDYGGGIYFEDDNTCDEGREYYVEK